MIERRAPQDESIRHERHDKAKAYAGGAGDGARQQRDQPGRGEQFDLEIAKPASQPVACQERDGDCEHDAIVVEHVGTAPKIVFFRGMLWRRFMQKVGSGRLAIALDQRVRDRDPAGKSDRADDGQDQAVAVRTRRGQSVADSQTLPEMSHFAAEF